MAIAVALTSLTALSQELIKPNFALASHPMTVARISQTLNETVFELAITNKSESGSFCADRNIFVEDILTGEKFNMIRSEGIPTCPANYQFKYVGEVLTFRLYFPKIESKKYLTLIEDCNQYCFSIKGIVLDEEFNKNINAGYEYYGKGMPNFALQSFKEAINANPDYPYCLHYLNIIQIYAEMNDFSAARAWYDKIIASDFRDKAEVLNRLKKQPYYKELSK